MISPWPFLVTSNPHLVVAFHITLSFCPLQFLSKICLETITFILLEEFISHYHHIIIQPIASNVQDRIIKEGLLCCRKSSTTLTEHKLVGGNGRSSNFASYRILYVLGLVAILFYWWRKTVANRYSNPRLLVIN